MEALERNNTNVGGWYMNRGQEQLVIRGTGWLDHGEEGLEQLRMIENGIKIQAVPVEIETGNIQSGIDTPEDLTRAEAFLKART